MEIVKTLDELLSLFIEGIEALVFIIRLRLKLWWEDYGEWLHTPPVKNCRRCGQPAIKALDWKWCSKRCMNGEQPKEV